MPVYLSNHFKVLWLWYKALNEQQEDIFLDARW